MKIFSHGILGMNARNLKYIRTKNTGDRLSLADSKLKTKNFLSGRGIPFAETYATIDSQAELNAFSFDSIAENSFVIKPNHGSKGQGILIVKKWKNNTFIIDKKIWSENELRLFMTDILWWAFSLYGNHDRIVIEELMLPGKEFAKYCRHWLADIRMIVYNYVPVTAMVRMPTELSGGKANLAQGGIGLWITISRWEVFSFFQHKKNYTEEFPDGWNFLKWSKVSFWDNILLYSSQIQFYTGLGYLALDWVITKNGPKLLEINARAGLEIQNVNLVPLAKRLEQLDSLVIKTPEKGVEIAKTLFNTDVSSDSVNKKIIHFTQRAIVRWSEVIIRVDPQSHNTKISKNLAKKFAKWAVAMLWENSHIHIEATGGFLDNEEMSTIVLGQDHLSGYLISPEISPSLMDTKNTKHSPQIIGIDKKMYNLHKKLNFTALLRPQNYQEELEKFLENPYQYNPVFEYKYPNQDSQKDIEILIDDIKNEIDWLPTNYAIFAKLYTDKLNELKDRLSLIIAYRDKNYEEIAKSNRRLFGEFSTKLLDVATKKVFENARNNTEITNKILWPVLSIEEIVEEIKSYCKERRLPDISVNISPTTVSRLAVAYKKWEAHINISERAKIRKNELKAVLAHEIGVHLRRYLGGKNSWLKLFEYGTGYYLTDEEGLAIYNSLTALPKWYEKNAMYLKYYLLSQADQLSFSETASLVQSMYPKSTPRDIFGKTARLKRGLIDTSISGIAGTTFLKDKVYLDWYYRIKEWIDEGGDKSLLYTWKVKISDLPLIAKI